MRRPAIRCHDHRRGQMVDVSPRRRRRSTNWVSHQARFRRCRCHELLKEDDPRSREALFTPGPARPSLNPSPVRPPRLSLPNSSSPRPLVLSTTPPGPLLLDGPFSVGAPPRQRPSPSTSPPPHPARSSPDSPLPRSFSQHPSPRSLSSIPLPLLNASPGRLASATALPRARACGDGRAALPRSVTCPNKDFATSVP
jgi:hypothetical protein